MFKTLLFKVSVGLKLTEKDFTTSPNQVLFKLLIVKSFEMLPTHSHFRVFCFKLIYFLALTNKKLLLPL